MINNLPENEAMKTPIVIMEQQKILCLECGYIDSPGNYSIQSEEAIPLCPKCLSIQLQFQKD